MPVGPRRRHLYSRRTTVALTLAGSLLCSSLVAGAAGAEGPVSPPAPDERAAVVWDGGGEAAALSADQPSTSLADVNALIGADALHAQGLTGKGVDVAVIDTGIMPGGALEGRVVNGPDLSFDAPLDGARHLDGYGHGTNMASILAADDGATGDGVAPGARLVNVKVGASDGSVDVSQIIAAIDWVVQHRQSGDLDIRVLNLSLGTDGTQRAALDPLAHAVDVAWRNGIVVVASVGNDGRDDGSVANPAINPNILAVGAVDSLGSRNPGDVAMAEFSSVGNGKRKPDLAAPGARLLGSRVAGSFLDQVAPAARRGEDLFRGSGTSQSAAVVSGAAALLLEQRPELRPEQVKELLLRSAYALPEHKKIAGRGLVDVAAAAAAPTPDRTATLKKLDGTGSLDAARGSVRLVNEGQVLDGERDVHRAAVQQQGARRGGRRRRFVVGRFVVGRFVVGRFVVGRFVVGRFVVGRFVVGRFLVGRFLVGRFLVGRFLVGRFLVGRFLVGRFLVRGGSWSGAVSWSGGSWSGDTWFGSSWA